MTLRSDGLNAMDGWMKNPWQATTMGQDAEDTFIVMYYTKVQEKSIGAL